MQTPEDRAVHVIENNKYMVLATADLNGPWAAALAFTIVGHGQFAFISQRSSRHGSAISKMPIVAGVIFNSQVDASEAESVQFTGICVDVGDDEREIRRLLAAGGACDGAEISEVEVTKIKSDAKKGVYITTVDALYVLDQVAWEEHQIDAREAVNKDEVFRRMEPGRAHVD